MVGAMPTMVENTHSGIMPQHCCLPRTSRTLFNHDTVIIPRTSRTLFNYKYNNNTSYISDTLTYKKNPYPHTGVFNAYIYPVCFIHLVGYTAVPPHSRVDQRPISVECFQAHKSGEST